MTRKKACLYLALSLTKITLFLSFYFSFFHSPCPKSVTCFSFVVLYLHHYQLYREPAVLPLLKSGLECSRTNTTLFPHFQKRENLTLNRPTGKRSLEDFFMCTEINRVVNQSYVCCLRESNEKSDTFSLLSSWEN